MAFCIEDLMEATESLSDNNCEPVSFLGETIFFCRAEQPWQDSSLVCEQLCGRLMIAKSDEKRVSLYNAITEIQLDPKIDANEHQSDFPTASLWVGAYGNMGSKGEYKWVNSDVMPSQEKMNGWPDGDPNSEVSAGVILALYGKGADNSYWFDRGVNASYVFACESHDAPLL